MGLSLGLRAQDPTDAPKDGVIQPVTPIAKDAALPSTAPGFVLANTWRDRFQEYGKKLFGVQAVVQTLGLGVWDHETNFPHEWGRDLDAFPERLESQYGQFLLDQTIQLALWGVHKEDSHYFRSGEGNFFRRTGHALKGTLVVSNPSGGQTFAMGAVAGSYGSWAIATRWWEPRSERGAGQVMLWGSAGLVGKAASNFVREFWPDARRKLPHRRAVPLAAWPITVDR